MQFELAALALARRPPGRTSSRELESDFSKLKMFGCWALAIEAASVYHPGDSGWTWMDTTHQLTVITGPTSDREASQRI